MFHVTLTSAAPSVCADILLDGRLCSQFAQLLLPWIRKAYTSEARAPSDWDTEPLRLQHIPSTQPHLQVQRTQQPSKGQPTSSGSGSGLSQVEMAQSAVLIAIPAQVSGDEEKLDGSPENAQFPRCKAKLLALLLNPETAPSLLSLLNSILLSTEAPVKPAHSAVRDSDSPGCCPRLSSDQQEKDEEASALQTAELGWTFASHLLVDQMDRLLLRLEEWKRSQSQNKLRTDMALTEVDKRHIRNKGEPHVYQPGWLYQSYELMYNLLFQDAAVPAPPKPSPGKANAMSSVDNLLGEAYTVALQRAQQGTASAPAPPAEVKEEAPSVEESHPSETEPLLDQAKAAAASALQNPTVQAALQQMKDEFTSQMTSHLSDLKDLFTRAVPSAQSHSLVSGPPPDDSADTQGNQQGPQRIEGAGTNPPVTADGEGGPLKERVQGLISAYQAQLSGTPLSQEGRQLSTLRDSFDLSFAYQKLLDGRVGEIKEAAIWALKLVILTIGLIISGWLMFSYSGADNSNVHIKLSSSLLTTLEATMLALQTLAFSAWCHERDNPLDAERKRREVKWYLYTKSTTPGLAPLDGFLGGFFTLTGLVRRSLWVFPLTVHTWLLCTALSQLLFALYLAMILLFKVTDNSFNASQADVALTSTQTLGLVARLWFAAFYYSAWKDIHQPAPVLPDQRQAVIDVIKQAGKTYGPKLP